ncbi:MAG: hypothetical protein ABI480_03520 [Chitinophagaceae bacterium]
MRRIFSERNLIVILFVMALAFFVIAQQDARKVEKIYMSQGDNATSASTMVRDSQPASDSLQISSDKKISLPSGGY